MKIYITLFFYVMTLLSLTGQNIPIDFEADGNGAAWNWTVFENDANPAIEIIANPDPTGINTSATVAKITALQAGQPWAGCESLHGAGIGSFTIDENNAVINIMVWKSVISDVGIKLVTSTGWSKGELKVANTKTNEWEQLSFDFSNVDHENMTYDQIVIFPDFDLGGRTADNVVYFDNVYGEGEIVEPSTINLPISFETAVTTSDFVDFDGGTATVVANPFMEGINTSATVGRIVRDGGAAWGGSKIALADNLDFSVLTKISMKVYTTAPIGTVVKFKLEGGAAAAEMDALTTTSGEWETLEWTFLGAPNDNNELVFMFDFGNVGDGSTNSTFYFDDVEQVSGPVPPTGETIPIDYETPGNGADWNWTVFENDTNPALEIIDNPDPSGINTSATVAKFTALQAGQPWAGCETLHGAGIGEFTIDEDNALIRIMVWKSVISDVGIKLVTSTGWSKGELKIPNTKINEWEQITFDFSTVDHENMTYDQIVIFPDFDLAGRTSDNVIYFDNVYGDAISTSTSDLNTIDLKLFPNPANNTLTMQSDESIDQYEIYSITGALVGYAEATGNNTSIDIAHLAKGIYMMKATSKGAATIRKFVKQ